jgi:hypothetical protein
MTTNSQEPTAPDDRATSGDGTASATDDSGDAPLLPAGDDVRTGPDQSEEPQAGAVEPTD